MSNPAGRDGTPDEQQAPETASEAERQAQPAGNAGKTPRPRDLTHLKSPQSLERLRDRVKAAARELERLRKENVAMAERIRKLESRPAFDVEGTLLPFDEDSDLLREKVQGFIDTIDKYLAGKDR